MLYYTWAEEITAQYVLSIGYPIFLFIIYKNNRPALRCGCYR